MKDADDPIIVKKSKKKKGMTVVMFLRLWLLRGHNGRGGQGEKGDDGVSRLSDRLTGAEEIKLRECMRKRTACP